VGDWLKHGGPSEQRAQEILRLLEASLDGDQTGLRIERDQGTLYFNHTIVTFVVTPAPPP
jgi:hypothetical protein